MTTPDMQELKTIVDWVNATEDVREFSLKVHDVELFISKNREPSASNAAALPVPVHAPAEPVPAEPVPAAPSSVPATAAVSSPAVAAEVTAPSVPAVEPASPETLAANEVLIEAPMVGVFYASPQPGAPTFVSVGDRVSEDTVLGIVEVMKLMNNIEARVAGEVVRILVDNEQSVEFGQPLMVIKTSA